MRRDLTVFNLEFPDQKKLTEYWNKRYSCKFHTEVLGRLKEEHYEFIRNDVHNWYKLQDEILTELFDKQSDIGMKTTFLRVKLLNEFYSTNVPDVCIYSVAKNIANNVALHKLIMKPNGISDKKKAVDDISLFLVNKIFKDNNKPKIAKEIYSFATKFCHFSNPKEYSIYDKYVASLLADYIKKYKDRERFKEIITKYNEKEKDKDNFINLEKITKTSILISFKDYDTFISFIDAFIDECNIKGKNIRTEVDNYLWLAGMKEYRK